MLAQLTLKGRPPTDNASPRFSDDSFLFVWLNCIIGVNDGLWCWFCRNGVCFSVLRWSVESVSRVITGQLSESGGHQSHPRRRFQLISLLDHSCAGTWS